MGTDINGHIEYRPTDRDPVTGEARLGGWTRAEGLGELYGDRDYDLFGCLFGVRNYAGFAPVAAGRGLPADLDPQTRARVPAGDWADCHDPTWLTWAEAAAIDDGERAEKVDERVHEFRRAADGTLAFTGKSAWSRRFETLAGSGRKPGEAAGDHPEGTEWDDGDTVFRIVRLTRGDVLSGNWRGVWRAMEDRAAVHGPENVRLVVWFDS